jgi:hypothetical protein
MLRRPDIDHILRAAAVITNHAPSSYRRMWRKRSSWVRYASRGTRRNLLEASSASHRSRMRAKKPGVRKP